MRIGRLHIHEMRGRAWHVSPCCGMASGQKRISTGNEAVDVGLGVPVFIAVTGATEEAVVNHWRWMFGGIFL